MQGGCWVTCPAVPWLVVPELDTETYHPSTRRRHVKQVPHATICAHTLHRSYAPIILSVMYEKSSSTNAAGIGLPRPVVVRCRRAPLLAVPPPADAPPSRPPPRLALPPRAWPLPDVSSLALAPAAAWSLSRFAAAIAAVAVADAFLAALLATAAAALAASEARFRQLANMVPDHRFCRQVVGGERRESNTENIG